MSILFAATYPERTAALILYGTYAKKSWSVDNPHGWTDERWATVFENTEKFWGTPKGIDLAMWAPSIADDPQAANGTAAYFRAAASPGAVLAVWQMNREIDVRNILPAIQAPMLVLHRTEERVVHIAHPFRRPRRTPAQGCAGCMAAFHGCFGDVNLPQARRGPSLTRPVPPSAAATARHNRRPAVPAHRGCRSPRCGRSPAGGCSRHGAPWTGGGR